MPSVPTLITALGDYGFTDSTNTEKTRAIQGAIWDIERKKPWPFLESTLDLTFNGLTATPVTSTTQIRGVLRARVPATGNILRPIRLDGLEDLIGSADNTLATGTPSYYYMDGGALKFFPIPPSGTIIRCRFIKWSAEITETSLESAILIPPRYFEAILYGALVRLMDKEDDPELSSRFEGHYNEMVQDMVDDAFRQQWDEPDILVMTDVNDYLM